MRRLRLHIIAVLSISLVIILLFRVAGPKEAPPQPATPLDNNKITVISASWGLNCNPGIKTAIDMQSKEPVKKDKEGKIIPPKLPTIVKKDNILEKINTLCKGKRACEVLADNETLGLDPYEACYKKLDVSYRCFELDRLRFETVDQGVKLKMDCSPKNAKAKDAEPAPAQ